MLLARPPHVPVSRGIEKDLVVGRVTPSVSGRRVVIQEGGSQRRDLAVIVARDFTVLVEIVQLFGEGNPFLGEVGERVFPVRFLKWKQTDVLVDHEKKNLSMYIDPIAFHALRGWS